MNVKSFGVGVLLGFIFHIIFAFLCIVFLSNDHSKIFNLSLIYSICYICIVIISYFKKRRELWWGLLVAFFIPVLVFVIIQFLVILAYRSSLK